MEYWADKPSRLYCSVHCRTAERWSVYDHLVGEWRQQYLAGDSYKTIAARYGRVPNTVRGVLQYFGVEPRNRWETANRIYARERAEQRPTR